MPKRGTKAASTRLREQVENNEEDDLTLQSTKVSELEYFYEIAGYLFGISACKFMFLETKSIQSHESGFMMVPRFGFCFQPTNNSKLRYICYHPNNLCIVAHTEQIYNW